MGEKDTNGEQVKDVFSDPIFIRRSRNVRGDRKNALKVQLSHAMDQIAIDVRQAIELYAKEGGAVGTNQ